MYARLTRFPSALSLMPLLAASIVANAEDTFVYEVVGGWTVRTDRAHNYDCFAEAIYDNEAIVRIGVDSTGPGSSFLFADPAWENVEPGSGYAVVVRFDGTDSWSFDATGVSVDAELGLAGIHFEVPAADRRGIVETFMRASLVEVALGSLEPVTLSLNGSFRATETAAECQIAMTRLREPNSGIEVLGNGSSD